MKVRAFLIVLPLSLLHAQSERTQYRRDLNGNMVQYGSSTSNGNAGGSVISRNVNGRSVPLEKSDERVISDSASGKVTEIITHRYSPDGVETGTERTIMEEQKSANGSSTVRTTVYRPDLNGGMQPGEQKIVETQKQGDVTNVSTTISRPSINGGFQPVEQRKAVTTGDKTASQQNEVVYRAGTNGQMYEAARNITNTVKQGDKITVNSEHSEPDVTGRMTIESREVRTVTKASDGTEVEEINIFAKPPTRADSGSAVQSLRQQRTIVRKPGVDGTIKETTTMRQPSAADPNRLENPTLVSETICSGKCQTPEEKPEPQQAPAAQAPAVSK